MLTAETYRNLYSELNEILRSLHPKFDQPLYDEIWLQKSVLNAEMAIAEHGRGIVISNLKEVINEPQRRLTKIATKELFVIEASKDIDWN